jgi:hypothetical protein
MPDFDSITRTDLEKTLLPAQVRVIAIIRIAMIAVV